MADFLGAGIYETICFPHLADGYFQQRKLHQSCTDYCAEQERNCAPREVSAYINSRLMQIREALYAICSPVLSNCVKSLWHDCFLCRKLLKKSIQNKNRIDKRTGCACFNGARTMPHILLPLPQHILLLGKDSFFLKDFFQDSLPLLLSLHPVSKGS